MEFATIEREIFIDAEPDVVYEVVSDPRHVSQWWPEEADYEPVPGSNGQIAFGPRGSGCTVVGLSVIEAQPPTTFTFRWTQAPGEQGREGNSMLVTFRLTPQRGGTLLTMTESGFREMGWEVAVLEQQYNEHIRGWDHYLPRLSDYAVRASVTR